jgi:hypothetical protein
MSCVHFFTQIRCLVLHVARCRHLADKNVTEILQLPIGIDLDEFSGSETANTEPEDYEADTESRFRGKFSLPVQSGPAQITASNLGNQILTRCNVSFLRQCFPIMSTIIKSPKRSFLNEHV